MILSSLAFAATLWLGAPSARAQPRESIPPKIKEWMGRIAWTPALTRSLVQKMPKVETHLHLDGALSPRTIQELAQAQGHAPLMEKSLGEIRHLAVVEEPRENLAKVLDAFNTVYPLLRDPRALEKVTLDLVNVSFQGVDSLFLPEDQRKALRESFEAEIGLILDGIEGKDSRSGR